MKKVLTYLGLMALVILILYAMANAETTSFTANDYCATTYVDGTTKYQNITFPTTSRHVLVVNNDASQYVWVNPKSATATTVNTSACFLLKPGNGLEISDFGTEGISILYDNQYSSGEASPISIMVSY